MKEKGIFFAVTALVVLISVVAVQWNNIPNTVPEIKYVSSSSETSAKSFAESLPTAIFPIDINMATKEELVLLDGIGEVLAERIVKFRDDGNIFYSVDDLMLVSGIGEKTIEKNKGKIYVNTGLIPSPKASVLTDAPPSANVTEAATSATEESISSEASETSEVTAEITTAEVEFPLDINSASADELCFINGIGPVLAVRIVEYRNENGGYYYVDELLNVNGIGEKILLKIKPYVYADTSQLPPRAQETEAPPETEETFYQRYSVNLNTATYDDLKQLGISDRLVGNILELREKIGYFTNTLELLYADGMTNEIYNFISGYVYV